MDHLRIGADSLGGLIGIDSLNFGHSIPCDFQQIYFERFQSANGF
jgi:hypothetical protein